MFKKRIAPIAKFIVTLTSTVYLLVIVNSQVAAQQAGEAVEFTKTGTAIGIFCANDWTIECIVNSFLRLGLSIVGGVAFLLLIFGAYKVLTSAGNQETLIEAREIIIAAISGLIFVVFSVTLLKIIGRDIFNIF